MIALYANGLILMMFFMAFVFFMIGAPQYSLIFIEIATMIPAVYFTFLFTLIASAIPYFILGQQAGFKFYGIGLLPGLHNYTAFTLPHRKFHLGLFSTYRRKVIFWVWFIIDIILYFLTNIVYTVVMSTLSDAVKDPYNHYYTDYTEWDILIRDPALLILAVGYALFLVCMLFIRSIFHWRKNYDLLKTYGYDKHAIWASVVNIFCPLVMIIFSYKFINRQPVYGDGHYYNNGIPMQKT